MLDGVMQLDPWEELAYRRILDLIYASGNRLVDDDKKLAWMTKTGHRWKGIRKVLFGGDIPKLSSVDGFIRNEKCDTELKKIDEKVTQNSEAGKASAAKRKALKDKETASTGVENPLPENTTQTSTEGQPTHLTTEPVKKEVKEGTDVPKKGDGLVVMGSFDYFWGLYPRQRRGNKEKARRAYMNALSEFRATENDILEGVKAYAASQEVANKRAKGCEAWLNDDRWGNDYAPPTNSGGGQGAEIKAEMQRMADELAEKDRMR